MTPVRVKICGITRAEDAELAVRLGAHAIGFVFWPNSPRAIEPRAARAISDRLPPLVVRVGVFVDAAPDDVARIVQEAGLEAVQLHGDESTDLYERIPTRLVKAVTVASAADVERAATLPAHVTLLVDAHDPVKRGGTGQRANWKWAAALAARRPVILAGGVTAENAAAALRAVRPWALDVSSGVEDAPGVKSADRMKKLFAAIAAEDRRSV